MIKNDSLKDMMFQTSAFAQLCERSRNKQNRPLSNGSTRVQESTEAINNLIGHCIKYSKKYI